MLLQIHTTQLLTLIILPILLLSLSLLHTHTQVAVLVASHCAASLLQGLSPLEYDVARGVPINIGGGGSTSFFHDGLEVSERGLVRVTHFYSMLIIITHIFTFIGRYGGYNYPRSSGMP